MPVYKNAATLVRACHDDKGGIKYLEEPDYHGNPIVERGSLVAREWGPDIVEFIKKTSGMKTTVHTFNESESGLEAAFLDVLVSRKSPLSER